ncbi:MAG TPA: YihY/virulence factor BrkB family protein [Thermoanaerobaculia bacterium]|jgi:membrane protein|nr:YihY/virulence factor BrkB family protein [Thermoanaerobaculia bacterium]
MNPKSGFGLIKDSFKEWQDDDSLQLGAALSYYAIFSLAPMLLIVIAVAGLIYGRDAVQGQLVGELGGLVGPQGGQAIQSMIASAGKHGSGVLATVVGVVTILFGATGVFVQLQDSLNKIWDVEAKPGLGLRSFIMTRVVSFGMILGIGFLLLISLVVSAAVSAVGAWATGLLPGAKILIEVLTFLVSFGVVTLLFAMLFKFLPDVKLVWRDVWIGAVATALLFTVGKFLIGLYLGRASVISSYGAAGSVVVLLLWIYYSSQILFFGAEFTKVYASRHGSHVTPEEHAVPVVQEKREVSKPGEWPPNRQKEGGDKQKGAPERPQDSRKRTGS